MSLKERQVGEPAPVLEQLPQAELDLVLGVASRRSVPRGTRLVRQGEHAETLFFVLRGCFDVLRDDRQLIAEIRAGEPIGEIAFFSGMARTASVVAARDGEVLELTREAYETLAGRTPAFTEAILRSFAQRLGAAAATARPLAPRTPRTVAVLPIGREPPGGRALRGFLGGLGEAGAVVPLEPTAVPEGSLSNETRFAEWLDRRAQAGGTLALLADGTETAFTRAALRQCDQLLLLARLEDSPPVPEARTCTAEALALFRPQDTSLVLLRERSDEPIAGTRRWLDALDVQLHHHLALDSPGDFARLSRFLSGRALGMVFGGGGALGAAHLGMMRALLEAGAVFDVFGGTSIGSSIAMEFARGSDPSRFSADFEAFFLKNRALSRLTVPFYSVFDHHHFDDQLRRRYGLGDIEDCPLAAFAVCTNLTDGEIKIVRRGPVWQAIRASCSIPGALPPFVGEDGEVLVDGGVLDNVPLGVMRAMKPGPNVAINLSRGKRWTVKRSYDGLPLRGALARQLALRRHSAGDFPRIIEVIARTMTVTSSRLMRSFDLGEDLLLEPPPLKGMGILDWGRIRAQDEAGYAFACAELERAGGFEALLAEGRQLPLAGP